MAMKYPKGAIKSKDELLQLCKKQNIFYIVDDDSIDREGVIKKIKLSFPFVNNEVFIDNIGQRYLETCNLVKATHGHGPLWKNNFIFANYWHAFAYSVKCKQGRMENTDEP